MSRIRSTPRPGVETFGRDFALQEHVAMLAKLDRAGEDIYRTETVVPLAVAAYYAWLLSRPHCAAMPWWPYLVPPILSFLGYARYSARLRYIRQAEKYVRKLESRLRGVYSETRGWEHFYKGKLKWYWAVRTAFWLSFILATTSVAILYYRDPALLCGPPPTEQATRAAPPPVKSVPGTNF